MSDVVVIGGGLAGLTAAYRLMKLGADVRVLERAPRAGGHVATVERSGWRHEAGPNSLLFSATAVFALAEELGVEPVQARPEARRRYLFLDGRLQPLPSHPSEILTSPLLPAGAKLRLLKEPFVARPRGDETVREFCEARLGPELTDRFVDAFVSGVYAGDISKIGMAAAFPRIMQLVLDHGSLSKAAFAALRHRETQPRRGTWSFRGGLGALTDALVHRLGSRVHTGTDVTLSHDGKLFRAGELHARAAVVAAPAFAAADVVRPLHAELAEALAGLEYNPVAGVHMLYLKSSIPRALDGFGFLAPRREGLRTLGTLWPSALFDTCPPDHAVLTSFLGGAHDPEAVTLGDEALLQQARADLERTMGIVEAPADASILRIPKAIPSYGVGHVAWREQVRALAGATPGLHLCGNWLEGISVADTVTLAERTAVEVSAALATRGRAA